jgi:hypothetical protein
MKSAVLGLVMLGFSVSAGASARAEEKEPQAKFHLLLNEMLKERQKVRSGEVWIRGNRSGWKNGVKEFEGAVGATYLFDARASSYRYELVTQVNMEGKKSDLRFWYCLNPQYCAKTSDRPGSGRHVVSQLTLSSPARDAERRMDDAADRGPFDPLASGLSGYFESGRGETAANVYQGMLSKRVESYKLNGSTATINLIGETAKDTLVVDLELRAPLKLTSRSLLDPSVFTNTAKWKRIGGVVVPTEFTTRVAASAKDDDLMNGLDLRFEWSRINEPFEPEEFEFRAFKDGPVGIEVFDDRGRSVRYMGILKKDGEIVKDAKDIPELNGPRFPPRP